VNRSPWNSGDLTAPTSIAKPASLRYRLIAKDTFEKRSWKLQESQARMLADAIINADTADSGKLGMAIWSLLWSLTCVFTTEARRHRKGALLLLFEPSET